MLGYVPRQPYVRQLFPSKYQNNNMNILGINAYHGDSSAALLVDGKLASAVEEERYNRIKHWAGLPVQAAAACLRMAGTDQVDHIAISRDPKAHLSTKLLRVATQPSLWFSAMGRAKNSLRLGEAHTDLAEKLPQVKNAQFHYVEHHRAHLASAFFCSPFEEAAVLSIDGFGDFSSVMWGVGKGNKIDVRNSVQFPHSLGIYYTAITQFLGFLNYGDEYKMMGLGAYGEPRYVEQMRQLVHTEGDQIRLNLDYFSHHDAGVAMSWENGEPKLGQVYSEKLVELLGPARIPRTEIEQSHKDMAASAQAVLEENYFALLNYVQKETGLKAVCLAGGVALNCVANGMMFQRTGFTDMYVQPAAHDAGTSFGAALYVQHQILDQPRNYVMRDVYFGDSFDNNAIRNALNAVGANYHEVSEDELVDRTANCIADGNVLGWFQGKMEFGPRALGSRSILADPRSLNMKDTLNSRIKFREAFRPFCPSIAAERAAEFFETDYSSPFMVVAYKIKPEQQKRIPAVTHGDGTGRLQTVEKDVNPLYWKLINRFDQIAGVPVLINTSFNENEPIVTTPEQAIDCFLRTRMDALSIGNFFLLKTENQEASANRKSNAEVELAGKSA
jgi:carbamoyltransferase